MEVCSSSQTLFDEENDNLHPKKEESTIMGLGFFSLSIFIPTH